MKKILISIQGGDYEDFTVHNICVVDTMEEASLISREIKESIFKFRKTLNEDDLGLLFSLSPSFKEEYSDCAEHSALIMEFKGVSLLEIPYMKFNV